MDEVVNAAIMVARCLATAPCLMNLCPINSRMAVVPFKLASSGGKML